jgi:hypothetical protein
VNYFLRPNAVGTTTARTLRQNRRMAHVRYAVALVTYLDILGFKKLIATRSAGDISRIIRVVKEAVQPVHFKTKLRAIPDDQYVNFSDLSVIATPLEKTRSRPAVQLFSQLLHLVHAQSTLLFDEGIVIRGAVTIGEVVKSWGQLFGPAVIRAYELERDSAKYPRIIIDSRIFSAFHGIPRVWHVDERTDKDSLRWLMSKDHDGWMFVDYLRAMYSELDDPSSFIGWLDQHRSFIRKQLRKHAAEPSIRQKYEWLDGYHRATIARMKTQPPRTEGQT